MNNVIFDFDGTIADSYHFISRYLVKNINNWGVEKNITNIDEAYLKTLSIKEILQYLKIPKRKVPLIIFQVRQEIKKNMDQILPISNILITLKTLKENRIKLFILSTNSKENINLFLKFNKSEALFDHIYSDKSFFSKEKKLKKIMKKHNMIPGCTFYIGDESRDVHAAKCSKIKSIAVTWGFESQENLIRCRPDHIINKPCELLEF